MDQVPQQVIDATQASARKWRVPASVTIAQWALESAWGRHEPPGSNNPFGIKAGTGQPSVACETHEVIQGRTEAVIAHFRKYASIAEAFDEHGRLLATARPYEAAMKDAGDPNAFARALTGHYATDPHYGDKLIAIMQENNLYRFDVKPEAVA